MTKRRTAVETFSLPPHTWDYLGAMLLQCIKSTRNVLRAGVVAALQHYNLYKYGDMQSAEQLLRRTVCTLQTLSEQIAADTKGDNLHIYFTAETDVFHSEYSADREVALLGIFF